MNETTHSEPIVIEAVCFRWNHNRQFKCLRMKSGPPHVLKFIGNDGDYVQGAGMFIDLMEKGYTFSVETKFVESSPLEMADIIARVSEHECGLCGAPATIKEAWASDEEHFVCDACSVPGVGERLTH